MTDKGQNELPLPSIQSSEQN